MILPGDIYFGADNLNRIADIIGETLLSSNVLIVTDKNLLKTGVPNSVLSLLEAKNIKGKVWDKIDPDPAMDDIINCCKEINNGEFDSIVAIGGGSVIDVAKVSSKLYSDMDNIRDYTGLNKITNEGIPVIAIPTLFGSGSESSSHSVIYDEVTNKKEVYSGKSFPPDIIIIEPSLSKTVKKEQLIYSAMDGLIHALESFTSKRSTKVTKILCKKAIENIVESLPQLIIDNDNIVARIKLSLGCFYSGIAMTNTNAGVIHALGYPLTTFYGIPHGLANTLMAPAALAYVHKNSNLNTLFEQLESILLHSITHTRNEKGYSIDKLMESFIGKLGIKLGLENYKVQENELLFIGKQAAKFKPVLQNTPCKIDINDLVAMYKDSYRHF